LESSERHASNLEGNSGNSEGSPGNAEEHTRNSEEHTTSSEEQTEIAKQYTTSSERCTASSGQRAPGATARSQDRESSSQARRISTIWPGTSRAPAVLPTIFAGVQKVFGFRASHHRRQSPDENQNIGHLDGRCDQRGADRTREARHARVVRSISASWQISTV
jgi:hypothetical protein